LFFDGGQADAEWKLEMFGIDMAVGGGGPFIFGEKPDSPQNRRPPRRPYAPPVTLKMPLVRK